MTGSPSIRAAIRVRLHEVEHGPGEEARASLWDVVLSDELAALVPELAPQSEPDQVELDAAMRADVEEVEPKRSAGLLVRLLPTEREAWHAAARKAGHGRTATWVRLVVEDRIKNGHSGGGERSAWSAAAVEDRKWRAGFARVGNNLNQLTRAVNIAVRDGQGLPGTLSADLDRLTREVRALRNAVEAGRS